MHSLLKTKLLWQALTWKSPSNDKKLCMRLYKLWLAESLEYQQKDVQINQIITLRFEWINIETNIEWEKKSVNQDKMESR